MTLLLWPCYHDISAFNSNECSGKLIFPQKTFKSCKKNCGTYSNHSKHFAWLSQKKVQHWKPIGPLKNKARNTHKVMCRVKFECVSQIFNLLSVIFIKKLTTATYIFPRKTEHWKVKCITWRGEQKILRTKTINYLRVRGITKSHKENNYFV